MNQLFIFFKSDDSISQRSSRITDEVLRVVKPFDGGEIISSVLSAKGCEDKTYDGQDGDLSTADSITISYKQTDHSS